MRGVVLSGGRSTRMGSDKGLLKQKDFTWSEIAFSKLASLTISVVVSVNRHQLAEYSKVFPADNLITDDESILVKGPLLGLLSVHQQLLHEDIFVLACDMIEINQIILQDLLGHYQHKSHEAYVYKTGEGLQPLCAIYTSEGLNKIDQLYQQRQLKNFSMMHVLECIKTKFIPVPENFFSYFNNYNSTDEIEKINSIHRMP